MAKTVDLSGLSDEERSAIEDDDGGMEQLREGLRRTTDDDLPAARADDAADDDDPDDADDDPAPTPAPTPAPAPAEAPTPAEAPPTAEAEADLEDPPPVRQFAYEEVEGFDDKMAELATKLADLKAKHRAGEIDLDAYEDERDKLSEEKSDLQRRQELATFERKTLEADQRAQWERAVDRFMGENKQYADDDILFSALNVAIKKIASTPESANKSNRWVLLEAHKEVAKRFTAAAPAPAPTPTPAPEDVRRKAVEERRTKQGGPRTLADTPAAAPTETHSTEFAELEALEGLDKERALARLSPEQADRYLRGG